MAHFFYCHLWNSCRWLISVVYMGFAASVQFFPRAYFWVLPLQWNSCRCLFLVIAWVFRFSGVTFPVYSLYFGADHDHFSMHDVLVASGGEYTYIVSDEYVKGAFQSYIEWLSTVIAQELFLRICIR